MEPAVKPRPARRRPWVGRVLVLLASWVAIMPASAQTGSAATETPAYHLERGSIARGRIVALGRDMLVDGDALSHAVVLDGSIRITGTVEGDVIVLSGDARLEDPARIGGDVYVLGGTIDMAPGAVIGGRSVAYPDAPAVWIHLMAEPTLGLSSSSNVVLGAQLALLAFWTLLVLVLFGVGPRSLLATSESIRQEPFRDFFVGLTGVIAMTLTAIFVSALLGAVLGLPLLVAVLVVALGLRFWGMVAVFHALGDWLGGMLCRRLGKRPPAPLAAATIGLLALGALKLLPWVGVWSWWLASFLGVGAALTTQLGRREPWLEPA